jgi:hypothetical protein
VEDDGSGVWHPGESRIGRPLPPLFHDPQKSWSNSLWIIDDRLTGQFGVRDQLESILLRVTANYVVAMAGD